MLKKNIYLIYLAIIVIGILGVAYWILVVGDLGSDVLKGAGNTLFQLLALIAVLTLWMFSNLYRPLPERMRAFLQAIHAAVGTFVFYRAIAYSSIVATELPRLAAINQVVMMMMMGVAILSGGVTIWRGISGIMEKTEA